MNIVQFASIEAFVTDVKLSEGVAVYNALVLQVIGRNSDGIKRWQILTIVRALAAVVRNNGT